MATPYLGEIRSVAFNFAPSGWALCNGATLPISDYEALFNLLGTTYGGNGTTTFQLPDLQGRVALHFGGGYVQGQIGGAETVTLTAGQLPTHNHAILTVGSAGGTSSPSNAVFAASTEDQYTALANAVGDLAATVVQATGSSQSHSNIQPYTSMYFIISLEGIFPSQS